MPWDEVPGKFKAGTLRSGGSGKKVTNPAQATAIMLSEKRAAEAGKAEYQPSGKPEHATRTLHPQMQQHAHAIKAAHAHLSKHVPGFRSLAPHVQFRHTQAHVRRSKGR